MNELEIKEVVNKQRAYFLAGNTLNINNRISTLKRIKEIIISR